MQKHQQQKKNTHIFRLLTPSSGVLPSNEFAASEVACGEVTGEKASWRGVGGGEFTYLRVAAGVMSATAIVHSVE
jgi:hypothetical protein